jgi:hypothetical protein
MLEISRERNVAWTLPRFVNAPLNVYMLFIVGKRMLRESVRLKPVSTQAKHPSSCPTISSNNSSSEEEYSNLSSPIRKRSLPTRQARKANPFGHVKDLSKVQTTQATSGYSRECRSKAVRTKTAREIKNHLRKDERIDEKMKEQDMLRQSMKSCSVYLGPRVTEEFCRKHLREIISVPASTTKIKSRIYMMSEKEVPSGCTNKDLGTLLGEKIEWILEHPTEPKATTSSSNSFTSVKTSLSQAASESLKTSNNLSTGEQKPGISKDIGAKGSTATDKKITPKSQQMHVLADPVLSVGKKIQKCTTVSKIMTSSTNNLTNVKTTLPLPAEKKLKNKNVAPKEQEPVISKNIGANGSTAPGKEITPKPQQMNRSTCSILSVGKHIQDCTTVSKIMTSSTNNLTNVKTILSLPAENSLKNKNVTTKEKEPVISKNVGVNGSTATDKEISPEPGQMHGPTGSVLPVEKQMQDHPTVCKITTPSPNNLTNVKTVLSLPAEKSLQISNNLTINEQNQTKESSVSALPVEKICPALATPESHISSGNKTPSSEVIGESQAGNPQAKKRRCPQNRERERERRRRRRRAHRRRMEERVREQELDYSLEQMYEMARCAYWYWKPLQHGYSAYRQWDHHNQRSFVYEDQPRYYDPRYYYQGMW